MKIKKILIANRGEIALRVIKTCDKLGIKSVSIFAEDDRDLLHAQKASESYCLGRGALKDTYLNQDKIIAIAKKSGADAIHPGYGFLSENSSFCEKVQKAGLIFIGPNIDAITLMGSKKESKVRMEKLGIPLVPGYHGDNQESAFLLTEAKKIGFPVLIKASAGGGGKGMRIVHVEKEFTESLAQAKREAMNAFSDDKVLIEKYIVNPRHIEVQLVSSKHGQHYHFFERECSIQRRYQKVVEETPAPMLADDLRLKMCQTAVAIAKGIDYLGAGTIEYILTPNNEFYFLEMNTRLQVEHPVTEMVTGYDLVELQILAAQGDRFDFEQKDIKQTGHAFEVRIYSEDADNGFLPTTGEIKLLESGDYSDYRLDTGYSNGNVVGVNYDPMLGKLIVHGKDRDDSLNKMLKALEHVLFLGMKTNRDFLKRIFLHPRFKQGKIHTHFLVEYEKDLLNTFNDVKLSLAAGALLVDYFSATNQSIKNSLYGFRNFKFNDEKLKSSLTMELDQKEYTIDQIVRLGEHFSFVIEHKKFEMSGKKINAQKVVLRDSNNKTVYCYQSHFGKGLKRHLVMGPYEVIGLIKENVQLKKSIHVLATGLLSPMPGKIFRIDRKIGDAVKKGDTLLVLEAMKMEHTIRAHKDGVVVKLFYKTGEQVQGGAQLAEIE